MKIKFAQILLLVALTLGIVLSDDVNENSDIEEFDQESNEEYPERIEEIHLPQTELSKFLETFSLKFLKMLINI